MRWPRFLTWLWRRRAPTPAAEVSADRRALLGAAPALAGAAAVLAGSPAASARSGATARRWGMVIDLDRCTNCGGCTIACKQENNVPSAGPGDVQRGAHIEWMSMLWQEPEQSGGLPSALPFPCQHCSDPPCVKVCPVGATYKDPEGITMQIWDRCIGCRYCMVACPYGRRSFNWQQPEWTGTEVQMLNPDVGTRPAGVMEKCTFCNHRLKRVREETALEQRVPTDAELQRLPACAAACPADAITFGDLNDPDSKVATQARSGRAFRLLEHLGTDPNVIYLK